VANVGIAALIIGSIAGLIVLVLRVAPGVHGRWMRALIGLVPGLIGAGIIGALNSDLVPDRLETIVLPWVIVAVTIGIIALTIRNLAEP
jgi:hypothetical protein